MAIFTGTAAGDTIGPTAVNGVPANFSGNDTLNGLGANDTLDGGLGNDQLFGGDGNDTLHSGTGDSIADGGADDDLIILEGTTAAATLTIQGGLGSDTLRIATTASTNLSNATIAGVERLETFSGNRAILTTAQVAAFSTFGGTTLAAGRDLAFTLADSKQAVDFTGRLDADLLTLHITGSGGNFDEIIVPQSFLGRAVLTSGAADLDISANRLSGGGGDDTLNGSRGFDELNGGGGADLAFGGDNSDVLNGGAGADILRGGEDFSDTFFGISGDTLNGDAGNDQLFGDSGYDALFGGTENDVLDGGTGGDELRGGAGNDELRFSADGQWSLRSTVAINRDLAWSSGGKFDFASISGKQQTTDIFDGAVGTDTLKGTALADVVLLSTTMADVPVGFSITDPRVIAVENFDLGNGNDVLNLSGRDYTTNIALADGGAGSDVLWGGAGSDLLVGGTGADFLVGGAGSDRLRGGTTAGGDGVRDVFGFGDIANAGVDTILDFEDGRDTLRLVGFNTASFPSAKITVAAGVQSGVNGTLITVTDHFTTKIFLNNIAANLISSADFLITA